jgi:predicted butyrate kinase (DUF1464 family)
LIMSIRVAGSDPGTSSLDLLILEDGEVRDQGRFAARQLEAEPGAAVAWLEERGPFALVAGPSGYGLPLVRAQDCQARDLAYLTLIRPDQQNVRGGIEGFSALVQAFCQSSLPVVFLPGVIHLPTVPVYRKVNRIDLGTADKLCVAALALRQRCRERGLALQDYTGCVLELGSAFTACLVVEQGQVVDSVGGTSGPAGWQGSGAWDGEVAYLLSPLQKGDLFTGGASTWPGPWQGERAFREGIQKAIAGLQAVTPFPEVVLSGRLLETEPELIARVEQDLSASAEVVRLRSLPGAWVKAAAQGSALFADGLAGGKESPLLECLQVRAASGTVLDWLSFSRVSKIR